MFRITPRSPAANGALKIIDASRLYFFFRSGILSGMTIDTTTVSAERFLTSTIFGQTLLS